MSFTSTGPRKSNGSHNLKNKRPSSNTKGFLQTDHTLGSGIYQSTHKVMSLKKVTSINNLNRLQLTCNPNQQPGETESTQFKSTILKGPSLFDCQRVQRKSLQFVRGVLVPTGQTDSSLKNYMSHVALSSPKAREMGSESEQTKNSFEKYVNNKCVIMERERVSMEKKFFKNILEDFHERVRQLQGQKERLQDLQNRFESYLCNLSLKTPESLPVQIIQRNYRTSIDENPDKSAVSSLKILNLEQKNQTLNFIIKQYRQGNKEEIKTLEKKINQYRPNIEKELTDKVQLLNLQLKKTQQELAYFKSQFNTHCPSFTWDKVILRSREIVDLNSQLEQQNRQLTQKTNTLSRVNQQLSQNQSQFDRLKHTLQNSQATLQLQNQANRQLESAIITKQQEIDRLERVQEEHRFRQQQYLKMQTTLLLKTENLKENSLSIAKLQSQNLVLQQKLISDVDTKHRKIFMEEEMRSRLEEMFMKINDLKRRTEESIFDVHIDIKQKKYFLSHLTDKISRIYEEIICQYRGQLILYEREAEEWKEQCRLIEATENRRKDVYSSMEQIREKYRRCEAAQRQINHNTGCESCRSWLAHWGQLNSLFTNLLVQTQRML